MEYHNTELYTPVIDTDLIREREEWCGDFSTIGYLLDDEASEDDCKQLLMRVLERASTKTEYDDTQFYDWFYCTSWYDDMWNAINNAIDEYIRMTARKIINEQED